MADGDSITAGQGGGVTTAYPQVAWGALTGSYMAYNYGTGGATCASLDAAAPTGVDLLLSTNITRRPNDAVLSVMCGANGFVTPTQVFNDLKKYVQDRQTAGWKHIIVFTKISQTGVSFADQTSLNSMIRSNSVSVGYTVSDAGADANLGCSGCSTNTTYFNSDGTHPKQAGQNILGTTYYKATLASLGIN